MSSTRKYHFFWKLAGEDKFILINSEKRFQLRFALSGFLIAILFIITVISYHHTFFQIFNIPNFSWIFSVIFSLIVFNIYKLNLITIAANPNKKQIGYLISLFFRICFMLLLGLTIIKPMETLLFKRKLNTEIAYLKVDEIKQAKTKTATYFDTEISITEREITRIKKQLEEGRILINPNEIFQLEIKKNQLILDKSLLIKETERRIDDSPYYVKGLILLNHKFPWVWLISFGFLILFLAPLFLKYFISRSTSYDISRSELSYRIIMEEYANFKSQYPLLFQESIGVRIELEERFEDPPFNMVPKTVKRNTGSEDVYLKYLNGL